MVAPPGPPPFRTPLDRLPVLGIAGWSGSGKTALVEELVEALRREGLRPAVVKHDAHGVSLDARGKDSDRIFRAGAEVLLEGPGERLLRSRTLRDSELWARIAELASRSDIVIAEGFKALPAPKLWLADREGRGPPDGVPSVVATLAWGEDRLRAAVRIARDLVETRFRETPLWGCILIGGKSSRMGRPKHLLPALEDGGGCPRGRSWLERTSGLLSGFCEKVVLAGAGAVPEALAGAPRLPDAPGIQGPMAGVLAAMRWAPGASWLVAACDLPRLRREALSWLVATRRPGVWATIPRARVGGSVEPLLAAYDFRARSALEDLASEGTFSMAALAGRPGVITPVVPAAIAPAWEDADLPSDLPRGRTSRARPG